MLHAIVRERHEQAAKPRDERGKPMSLRDQLMAKIRARRGGVN